MGVDEGVMVGKGGRWEAMLSVVFPFFFQFLLVFLHGLKLFLVDLIVLIYVS